MPILHWESWPLTSLPLFLIFSFIIYSLETPWWDIQKPWEHNRASGWPWSSHPWSILKKTYFPIWSLSPTPHLPGFNNVLQEGSSCVSEEWEQLQPGKEAELFWLSSLDSAELSLSQTTARNFWSSISFSWGELELVPTETPPALPPAMPWGSHKEKGH